MEEELKRYFQNCEYVARAPGVIFVEGNKYTKEAKMLPVPVYAYAGIEKNNFKKFFYEEQDITYAEKETEKDIIRLSDIRNFNLSSVDRSNRLFYFNEYMPTKKDAESFAEERIKIKVWSDIPPNIGLNESSAIASAIALLHFAYTGESTNETLLKFESLKKQKTICKEITINYSIAKIFLIALKFDFFSNGASILGSLIGLPKERRIIDYESLVYDELKKFLRLDPKVEYKKMSNRDIISDYEETCGYLSYKFFNEGLPLYKLNYVDFCFASKLTKQPEVSVINMYRPLDGTSINTKLRDANVKCFMIFPYSVAIFGSLKTVKFYEKKTNFIFKRNDTKIKVPIYGLYYNSWQKGWEIEGARLLKPEEYKLRDPTMVVQERLEVKKPEAEKAEYEVLRSNKKPAFVTKEEMEALEVKDYGLYFNVCTNEIFITSEKGTRKIELDKKPKEILIFLIENGGRMYDWLDLREKFFPDKKLPDGKEKPYGPEPIHKQMSILTGAIQSKKEIFIKKSANVPLKEGRLAYYFNPKASYCLIKYMVL